MKQGHPLRKEIIQNQGHLNRLCYDYYTRVSDAINPVYFSYYADRLQLGFFAEDLARQVEDLMSHAIRNSVEITLEDLMKKTGKSLDYNEKLFLQAKIENQMRRKYANKTLRQRLEHAKRFTASKLFQTYKLLYSGLNPSWKETFLGVGQSVYYWYNRLLTTEMLRAYHYTVHEFAKTTAAKEINFRFDKWQLERREEYKTLAEGGPYSVDNLPDYPRPYASYILEIKY